MAPVSPGRPVGGSIVVVLIVVDVSTGICTSGQFTMPSDPVSATA